MEMLINALYIVIGFLVGMIVAIGIGKAPWFKDLFSESSVASFGRVGAMMALMASIGWGTWVVYKTSIIPDLAGVSLFIGTLYGLSKAGSVVTAFAPKKDGQ